MCKYMYNKCMLMFTYIYIYVALKSLTQTLFHYHTATPPALYTITLPNYNPASKNLLLLTFVHCVHTAVHVSVYMVHVTWCAYVH